MARAEGSFSAYVQVYDENGDPLAGINPRLDVTTLQVCPCPFGEGEEPPPGGSQTVFLVGHRNDRQQWLCLLVGSRFARFLDYNVFGNDLRARNCASSSDRPWSKMVWFAIFLGVRLLDNCVHMCNLGTSGKNLR